MFMNSVNQQTMVGRVGQEPGVKYFESGAVKVSLTLAVKPPYKSDTPLWFDLELWSNMAQVAANHVKKGSTIGVSGELVFDRWTDRNTGEERYKPIIRCSNLELISSSRTGTETATETESEADQVESNF